MSLLSYHCLKPWHHLSVFKRLMCLVYITSHAILRRVAQGTGIYTEPCLFPFGCISLSNLSNVCVDNRPDVIERNKRLQPMYGVYFWGQDWDLAISFIGHIYPTHREGVSYSDEKLWQLSMFRKVKDFSFLSF